MIKGLNRSTRRRVKRQIRGRSGQTTLILVSLIDIFTNLVIFLMFSTTGVETLTNPKTIALPESFASQKPREAHVVMVTHDEVIFGDHRVLTLTDVQASPTTLLAPLSTELKQLPLKKDEKGVESRGEVNILADKDTPYSVIKRVMATCAEAGFARISLAVNERGGRT
jgi:biopolymer transport protein TolR